MNKGRHSGFEGFCKSSKRLLAQLESYTEFGLDWDGLNIETGG